MYTFLSDNEPHLLPSHMCFRVPFVAVLKISEAVQWLQRVGHADTRKHTFLSSTFGRLLVCLKWVV